MMMTKKRMKKIQMDLMLVEEMCPKTKKLPTFRTSARFVQFAHPKRTMKLLQKRKRKNKKKKATNCVECHWKQLARETAIQLGEHRSLCLHSNSKDLLTSCSEQFSILLILLTLSSPSTMKKIAKMSAFLWNLEQAARKENTEKKKQNAFLSFCFLSLCSFGSLLLLMECLHSPSYSAYAQMDQQMKQKLKTCCQHPNSTRRDSRRCG